VEISLGFVAVIACELPGRDFECSSEPFSIRGRQIDVTMGAAGKAAAPASLAFKSDTWVPKWFCRHGKYS